MNKRKWYQLLNQEASVATFQSLLVHLFRQLVSNYKLFLALLIGGALFGLVISYFKPVKYRAEIVFAAEEEGVTGFEGLMAQFGLDVGGTNPGGVFQGEGLVKVFQTRKMIERALLQKGFLDGDSVLLAQYLLTHSKFARVASFKNLVFQQNRQQHSFIADSALFEIQSYFRNNLLSVNKPDKRQSIIILSVSHANPQFAKQMAESLLSQVSDFYIEILTKKAKNNLAILQEEADSTRQLITQNLGSNAAEMDLNVNPLKQTLRVGQNKKMIDLQVSVALYGEIIKNLKLAEISLRKQTPLIQVIDNPVMPLEKIGFGLLGWTLIGMGMGALLFFFLLYKREEAN